MFVVHCKDKPGHSHVRVETRPAHLEYLKGFADKVVLGGPVLSDDRQAMVGSLIVLNFLERTELDAFLAGDPYAKAGLFESVTVLPFKKTVPQ